MSGRHHITGREAMRAVVIGLLAGFVFLVAACACLP
jgi:hypothetical protein